MARSPPPDSARSRHDAEEQCADGRWLERVSTKPLRALTRWRPRRAGSSALAKFRERRWLEIRTRWREWVVLTVVLLASLAFVFVTSGVMQLVFAGLVGAL